MKNTAKYAKINCQRNLPVLGFVLTVVVGATSVLLLEVDIDLVSMDLTGGNVRKVENGTNTSLEHKAFGV